MAQIAEAAGLQQSSIYYWFRSKSDDPRLILERVNRIPLAIVERERAAAGPVAERLHRLVREDVLALCGFPFDINEIHRLATRSPGRLRRLLGGAAPARRRGRGAGRRGRGVAASCAPVDARLAARTLLAADEATQNWFRSGRRGGLRPPRRSPTTSPRRRPRPARRPAAFPRPSAPSAGRPRLRHSSPLARQRSRSAAKAACCSARKAAMSSASASRKREVVGRGGTSSARSSSVELARLGRGPQVEQLVGARPGGSGSGRRSAAATARRARRPASARRGTRPAPCGRRTGSRPGPPCRTRTGRRRRCRRRSPGSRCGPGCTSWSPAGGGGRAAWRRARRGRRRRGRARGSAASNTMRWTSSTDVEAVDPADELEVRRAPRGVVAHDLHVAADRLEGGRVLPRQRQVHGAGVDGELAGRRAARRRPSGSSSTTSRRVDHGRVELHEQRAHARR